MTENGKKNGAPLAQWFLVLPGVSLLKIMIIFGIGGVQALKQFIATLVILVCSQS